MPAEYTGVFDFLLKHGLTILDAALLFAVYFLWNDNGQLRKELLAQQEQMTTTLLQVIAGLRDNGKD